MTCISFHWKTLFAFPFRRSMIKATCKAARATAKGRSPMRRWGIKVETKTWMLRGNVFFSEDLSKVAFIPPRQRWFEPSSRWGRPFESGCSCLTRPGRRWTWLGDIIESKLSKSAITFLVWRCSTCSQCGQQEWCQRSWEGRASLPANGSVIQWFQSCFRARLLILV